MNPGTYVIQMGMVLGSRFQVEDSSFGSRVECVGCKFRITYSGCGFQDPGFGFRVPDFGFRVSWLSVSEFGIRVSWCIISGS